MHTTELSCVRTTEPSSVDDGTVVRTDDGTVVRACGRRGRRPYGRRMTGSTVVRTDGGTVVRTGDGTVVRTDRSSMFQNHRPYKSSNQRSSVNQTAWDGRTCHSNTRRGEGGTEVRVAGFPEDRPISPAPVRGRNQRRSILLIERDGALKGDGVKKLSFLLDTSNRSTH